MITRREKYLDWAKFVAISMVVVRHVRDYGTTLGAYSGMAWLDNFTVVCGVVVFFMISGYFSRRIVKECVYSAIFRHAVVRLWPLVPLAVMTTLYFGGMLGGDVLVPRWGWIRWMFSVGWFFWCLVTCDVITFLAVALSRGRKTVLWTVMIFFYVVLCALPIGLFHVVEMIPFYWFGMFVYERIVDRKWFVPMGVFCLLAHFLVCVLGGDFAENGLSYHAARVDLSSITSCGFLLARIAVGMCAAVGLPALLRAVADRMERFEFLLAIGRQTLGVFYVHILILLVYYDRVAWCGGSYGGRLMISAAVLFVSYVIVWLTKSNKIMSAVFWNPTDLIGSRGG